MYLKKKLFYDTTMFLIGKNFFTVNMLVYPTINVLISIKDIDDRKVCESDEEQKCSLSATTLVNALNEFY